MTSAVEQMAQNFNFRSIADANDLKKRLWFTLGALIIYRLGTYIPLPGINSLAMQTLFDQQRDGILGMFDMFSGGALGRMTIFALNIIPYISASIIMQLMTAMMPALEKMKKEGNTKQINQYTRYLTVLLASVQAYGIAVGLEGLGGQGGPNVVSEPGYFFRATTVITLLGGTMFLMWLGEQVTSRGVGNGISLIIFAGIVANLPLALASTLELGRTGALSTILIIILIVLSVAVVAFIVFVERAQRKVIVQYPKRQVGNKLMGGENSHLPLKVNTAGVIPPIFASSLLLMPLTILGFSGNQTGFLADISAMLGRGQPLYMFVYISFIVFFTFFYTAIIFNPKETAENLRKQGGFIAGIRPGNATAQFLDFTLTRLAVVGAIYLALICALPEILISQYSVPFYFGGTSLLIVVNVTMDTVTQIQSHLFAHQYRRLLNNTNLSGKKNKKTLRKPRMK